MVLSEPGLRHGIHKVVTFNAHGTDKAGEPISAPSPAYLRLHAAAARVSYFSGAGEYIHRLLWDLECNQELASDGSSADLLKDVLSCISVH